LDLFYEQFLIVADEKKKVEDNDLIALAAHMPILVSK
jgi:hypothetical protein